MLFLISYGNINDLELTAQQLEAANDLPISVVIICIGSRDFHKINSYYNLTFYLFSDCKIMIMLEMF